MAVSAEDQQAMISAMRRALTGSLGPEWVSLHDIKFRLLNAKYSIRLSDLSAWLDHLVEIGKITRKTEDEKVLYHLNTGAALVPQVCKSDRQVRTLTPPRSEWPDWVKQRIDLIANDRDRSANENERLRQKIAELETAIMEHKQEQRRALSIYGSQNALEELTMQVALSPQYAALTPVEHRYVASVGLSSGLNPVFHLHAWKQKQKYKENGQQKEREVLMVVPDYKALIATAPDPIMTSDRRLSREEMADRGIPQDDIERGAIAYEVTGTNLKHANLARSAGLEYTPFKGYGWWAAAKEIDVWENGKKIGSKWVPNDIPSGRDGDWVARKRAIRDLFNQISDLRLKFGDIQGARIEDDGWVFEGDVIEGEFTEREPDGWTASEDAIQRAEQYRDSQGVNDDEINAALDCADWRKTALTAEEWKVVVDQIAVKHQIETSESESAQA